MQSQSYQQHQYMNLNIASPTQFSALISPTTQTLTSRYVPFVSPSKQSSTSALQQQYGSTQSNPISSIYNNDFSNKYKETSTGGGAPTGYSSYNSGAYQYNHQNYQSTMKPSARFGSDNNNNFARDLYPKKMSTSIVIGGTANLIGSSQVPASLFVENKPSNSASSLCGVPEFKGEKSLYTSSLGGAVIYKTGEQLAEKFKRGDDLSQSLTGYQAEKLRSQYKQPSYLDSGVYDNYYAMHSDADLREAELKTAIRGEIASEAKLKLVELFRELALIEREAEHVRQSLALQKDVSFDRVFKLFDKDSTNQVTPYELDRGFRDIGITADKIDIFLLVTRYSHDGNDSLSIGEFFEMIAPAKKGIECGHVYQDKHIGFKDMCDLSQSFFVKLVKVLLSEENMVQYYRKQFKDNGFDPMSLFSELDSNSNDTITHAELASWVRTNGIYISETELLRVFSRFDRNNSGNINRAEFAYELTPRKPRKNHQN